MRTAYQKTVALCAHMGYDRDMNEPTVCAVMLTNNRRQMAFRAMRSFLSQTYQNKRILVAYDPSKQILLDIQGLLCGTRIEFAGTAQVSGTIGAMRNQAADIAVKWGADIICHWDDDDWSHPNRIAEQVTLLQATGVDCVGYRDMLFWDTRQRDKEWFWDTPEGYGKAWVYNNRFDQSYCVGTSMCYWREAWERNQFDDVSHGEDSRWLRKVRSIGVESGTIDERFPVVNQPRMMASIHGGNTAPYNPPGDPNMWSRWPQWDEHCREVMAL
jgi:glycosyltransferase involved in cell wall biosynthesis